MHVQFVLLHLCGKVLITKRKFQHLVLVCVWEILNSLCVCDFLNAEKKCVSLFLSQFSLEIFSYVSISCDEMHNTMHRLTSAGCWCWCWCSECCASRQWVTRKYFRNCCHRCDDLWVTHVLLYVSLSIFKVIIVDFVWKRKKFCPGLGNAFRECWHNLVTMQKCNCMPKRS